MKKSPTQMSLDLLREYGWLPAIVEKYIAFGKVKKRKDLYQCMDIIAIKDGHKGVLGVQTTSYANVSERINKSMNNRALHLWLATGNRFCVVGWLFDKNTFIRYTWREITLSSSGELQVSSDVSGAEELYLGKKKEGADNSYENAKTDELEN